MLADFDIGAVSHSRPENADEIALIFGPSRRD